MIALYFKIALQLSENLVPVANLSPKLNAQENPKLIFEEGTLLATYDFCRKWLNSKHQLAGETREPELNERSGLASCALTIEGGTDSSLSDCHTNSVFFFRYIQQPHCFVFS